MKTKILILLCFIILSQCSLRPRAYKKEAAQATEDKTEAVSQTESESAGQSAATKPAAQTPQTTATASGSASTVKVRPPNQSSESDKSYVISELTFEVKKLSAEVKHLKQKIEDLEARSQMWTNPLDMYDKEIVTDNGSSFFGKVVYQDENIIKVETLIGYLVLNKKNVVRIISNIPERPAEQYAPQDVVTGLEQERGSLQKYVSQKDTTISKLKTAQKTPNCVLVGDIKEKKDRTGNTIFSGKIKNIGSRRADFVRINFIFRKNWSGDTRTKTTYVEGSHYTFDKSGITTNNSLLPGATGSFKLVLPKDFGSFIGYSYTIEWEQYQE